MLARSSYKYLMSAGHMCVDFNQGALAALIPLLVAAHHYDYATVAVLVMVSNLIGSVVQPVFGYLADRRNVPWALSLGLLLAGLGISSIGFLDQYWMLCIAVMVSGVGVAMYHPTAALVVNQSATRETLGGAISVFAFGGNLGFVFGPLFAASAVALWGMHGTAALIVPGLLVMAALLVENRRLVALGEEDRQKTEKSARQEGLTDDWGGFAKLCAVIFGRSIIAQGANTFLALYWIHVLGHATGVGQTVLSIFYALGAISTLCGGRLADRYGQKRIIILSCLLIVPFLLVLALCPVTAVASVAIIPIGIGVGLCYSPIVVTGQNLLPNRKGMASGVTLGLQVSVGGIFAPVLGAIGNRWGLDGMFLSLFAIGLIPLVFSFLLPAGGQKLKAKD